MGKKSSDPTQQLSPVRVAPLGELNAYTVHEHELDTLAAGSPATLSFNFAIALISVGVSFTLTLTTTKIESDRLFIGYLVICINVWIAGLYLLIDWLRKRTSVKQTVMEIKSRMPPRPGIQEPMPAEPNPPTVEQMHS